MKSIILCKMHTGRVLDLVEELIARPGVTDILVNSSRGIWIDQGNGLEGVASRAVTEAQVRHCARFLVARGGRHLDEAHPCIDVRAGEGIRVHAVLPPLSTQGTLISIRVARTQPWTLPQLIGQGMLTEMHAEHLTRALLSRENIILAGATGSGKTTLLGALLAEVPASERVITVEDTAELRIEHPHVVGLETRQANIEGFGEVGLTELVRQAMRMRPDRLVLGEARGAEFGTLLHALNSGHGGVGTTIHANSLQSIPARLMSLGLLSGVPAELCSRLVMGAFRHVAFIENSAGSRRVNAIGQLVFQGNGELGVSTQQGHDQR